MKKVVLLGDSIRLIGYGRKVEETLRDTYEIWQPADNCRFSSYTLRMLFDYKKEIENADIIHWNNGLWDACLVMGDGSFTPLDVYVRTMERIAAHLLQITDRVIFATTTPVAHNSPYDSNEMIHSFNGAVIPVLEKMGVQINDLHAVVEPYIEEYICEDLIHLSPTGADACAKKVIEAIKNADKAV